MFKTFLTRIFENLPAREFCEGMRIPPFIGMLSLPMHMARFELLCRHITLSHTWYVSRWERTRVFGRGGDRGCMKLNPARQDAAGQ